MTAFYYYHYPLDQLINRYKHHQQLFLERPLLTLWREALEHHAGPRPEALVPVPSHWQRLWLRGYNQAERLAIRLAKSTDVPFLPCLRRTGPTRRQQHQSRRQRQQLPARAFTVDRPLNGRRLALVDDVMTTGATARAASLALLRAGAARVDVWVLARTPEHFLPR